MSTCEHIILDLHIHNPIVAEVAAGHARVEAEVLGVDVGRRRDNNLVEVVGLFVGPHHVGVAFTVAGVVVALRALDLKAELAREVALNLLDLWVGERMKKKP